MEIEPTLARPLLPASGQDHLEGDAWLLPALHKHGGAVLHKHGREHFAAIASDPSFDGPRRGRTAEELEVALTAWLTRPNKPKLATIKAALDADADAVLEALGRLAPEHGGAAGRLGVCRGDPRCRRASSACCVSLSSVS